MVNRIHTDATPAAIGPYSQAMEAGKLIFTSGQKDNTHEKVI